MIALHQLQTYSLNNKTKHFGSLEPPCEHFSHYFHVSFANFSVKFRMSCSHRKVSLVRFSPISTSSYTFLRCFAITCETKNPNHKLSTTKSVKATETCAMNATLTP
jgi:hypothetical protein